MDTTFALGSPVLCFLLALHLSCHLLVRAAMDACYDEEGTPSRCMPKFENIAFNRTVVVSNVCGSPPEEFCMQTGSTRSCHQCDAADPERSHNAPLLTDFHRNEESTWWQSQSMYFGIQHPNSVNLTLHLGKAFEITYVRLKFYTSRPESFAIYKRTQEEGPWLPYQYYSASCKKTYGKQANAYIRPGDDERSALCTDEFSDISPLTGGNVAFSTLEGRPSAYNFDQSLLLQEWVTATDLLISLDRLNTFGDEFFKDPKVLRSYFYGISDFSVGGRCKCNGHASECSEGEQGRLLCVCQHHTAGDDCQRCHPFYQDRPWARATGDSANECLICNCSGRSDQCVFDAEQYRSTGSGGRCLSCRDLTDGPHCERCRENHYRTSAEEPCLPCICNINGSVSLQCDAEGKCACRTGVTGEKCDKCAAGFHSLGPAGCRPCECDPSGSVGDCSPSDGGCDCKANVEGQSCGRCKPGFYNLRGVNPEGCQACFCFGHSLACSSSSHHVVANITSDFLEDQDGWLGEFFGGQSYPLLWKEGEVYLLPLSEDDIGFYKAPEKFLGRQVYSYGQLLTITFTSETAELLPNNVTLLLQGSDATLTAELSPKPLFSRDPDLTPRRSFEIRLHEQEGFEPALSAFEFQTFLYNLTDLRISNAGGRNYTSQLTSVTLISAAISDKLSGPHARWVESCTCPPGFAGQFCEQCAPGFTRQDPGGGPLSPCVPCNCHQHGTCHQETGVCNCSDFTAGKACERCLEGYYGNALIGMPGDCQPCPCPDQSSCAQIVSTGQVVCTNCPRGQTGMRCQLCEDGYYGDPLGRSGAARPCERCDCNGNVDPNALGVCDHASGRCLKCLGHTEGHHCERCQRGFYGDALDPTAGKKCKPCSCHPAGTSGDVSECHPQTGRCRCLAHVTGRVCASCEVGFFNLQPGVGCERCQCNPVGSSSPACHPITGQCVCRAGVEGTLCHTCRTGFFGFSSRGCRACNCDPMGSVSMQCHNNGTCRCRRGFVGYKCDKCELNYFHNRATHQCEECPVCYGLVQKQAEKLRNRLQDLENLLARFDCRSRSGRHLPYPRRPAAEQQREESLPNALEDFLAFQEAREAFIKQFSSLEASTGRLVAQLHGVTSALNCSLAVTEGGSTRSEASGKAEGVCQSFTEAALVIRRAQKQLQQATLDLDNMVIPFEMGSEPNQWNTMVNESQVLLQSRRDTAEHIGVVAGSAVNASKQALGLLMGLLQDNSTEEYIGNLTERIAEMQEQTETLAEQTDAAVAEQLTLEAEAGALRRALANVTSSLHRLLPTEAIPDQTNRTGHTNSTGGRADELLRQTAELHLRLQARDELLVQMEEERRPLEQAARDKEEVLDVASELQARTHEAKVVALASVVEGKDVESSAMLLRRQLEDMVSEWPRRRAQTQSALKKERPLENKILASIEKRVSHIQEMLEPAAENSSVSRKVAKEAAETADAVAKESKDVLTQAKHARTASAHLGSHIDSALQRLVEQEALTGAAHSQITEPKVSLGAVKEDMEAARLELAAYSDTLTQLINKIDESVPLERFDRILNETARRLRMLRGSVESPHLGRKIQKLHLAAEEQRSQMSLIDQDLQDIREERDSLRDIASNLPRACPSAEAARG
ncbi:laminin subunit gamma-3 isoform X1 [Takifugu rubripes]|uniref:Laminin, gamma 3 n=1 Tax=Takifugu rubripes TaxID=31033 RepID=A0A674N0P9_TAKRU|nr:laminin subunit gamma-3 isoform X1 [Takifugu rubripes]